MRFLRYPEKTTSNINIRKTDNTALPLSFMISIRTAPKKLLSFIKVLPKEIPPGLIFWIVPRKESGSLSAKTPAPDTTANIDFVSFEHLLDSDSVSLVIGWEDSRNSKTVLAYSYTGQRLLPIFEREYSEIAITDLDSNGSTDLVLFTQQAQSTLVFLACRTDSGFETVDSYTLSRGIVSFDSIQQGKTLSDSNALFLDSTVDLYETPFQVTDVISAKPIEGSSPVLVNLLDNETVSLSQNTLRPAQNLFCRDIDEDGMIEIPTVSPLPGYESVLDENSVFMITYNLVSSNFQFVPRLSGVINPQHRYMIAFPERWLNTVTGFCPAGKRRMGPSLPIPEIFRTPPLLY